MGGTGTTGLLTRIGETTGGPAQLESGSNPAKTHQPLCVIAGDVEVAAALCRLPFDLEGWDVAGRRDAVERPVDDRGDTASRGGRGRGREALPFGAARLVDVQLVSTGPGSSTSSGARSMTSAASRARRRAPRRRSAPALTPTEHGRRVPPTAVRQARTTRSRLRLMAGLSGLLRPPGPPRPSGPWRSSGRRGGAAGRPRRCSAPGRAPGRPACRQP